MSKPLRVLLIEDSERDAALLQLYLRRNGYQATLDRVETGPEMRAQLDSADWDVVISDVNLPRFSAQDALKMLHESGRRIPFIVLSGEINEKVVQGMIEAGVSQYVFKSQMIRVVAAIDELMQARS